MDDSENKGMYVACFYLYKFLEQAKFFCVCGTKLRTVVDCDGEPGIDQEGWYFIS